MPRKESVIPKGEEKKDTSTNSGTSPSTATGKKEVYEQSDDSGPDILKLLEIEKTFGEVIKDMRKTFWKISSNEGFEALKAWDNGKLDKTLKNLTRFLLESDEKAKAKDRAIAEGRPIAEARAKARAEIANKDLTEKGHEYNGVSDMFEKAEAIAKIKAEAEVRAKAKREAKEKAKAEARAKAIAEGKLKAQAKAKAKEKAKIETEREAALAAARGDDIPESDNEYQGISEMIERAEAEEERETALEQSKKRASEVSGYVSVGHVRDIANALEGKKINIQNIEIDEDEDEDEYDDEYDDEDEDIMLCKEFAILLDILKDLITQLRETSSNLSQIGFAETDDGSGPICLALNKFINNLTALYNFIAGQQGDKPKLPGTNITNISDDYEDDDYDDDDDEYGEKLAFIPLSKFAKPDLNFSENELKQLDEFIKEGGTLEASCNNFAEKLRKRETLKENLKDAKIVPSRDAKYNESIIDELGIFKENVLNQLGIEKQNRKKYNILNICSENTISTLEKNIKSMKKTILKQSSIFKSGSISKEESIYLSKLVSTLDEALERIKLNRTRYDTNFLKKMHEIFKGGDPSSREFEENNAYDLREVRNFIMSIEDAVTPFLVDILSPKPMGKNDPPLLLFKIIDSRQKQYARRDADAQRDGDKATAFTLLKEFTDIIHNTKDEEKYKFLNAEHINRIIRFMEEDAEFEEMMEGMSLDARISRDTQYMNMRFQEKLLQNPALLASYQELYKAKEAAGRQVIDRSKLTPSLGEHDADENIVDAKKKINEKKPKNKNFGSDQLECAILVARVCGAISAGQAKTDYSRQFKDYTYNKMSDSLVKLIGRLRNIVNNETERNKLNGTLSEFTEILEEFSEELKADLPKHNLKSATNYAHNFANKLDDYTNGGGYKIPDGLLKSMEKLVNACDKTASHNFKNYYRELKDADYFQKNLWIELELAPKKSPSPKAVLF